MTGTTDADPGNEKIVIPAKAGIQPLRKPLESWIPAFAGMTSKSQIIEA
ncbi:MAG: hypothetical protein RR969_10550 [Thermomonas sp.]